MIATALNPGGSTGWFNPVAAIQVKSRMLSKFILPAIGILPTRPVFSTIHRFFLPVVYIEQQVTMNQCKHQYRCTEAGYTL